MRRKAAACPENTCSGAAHGGKPRQIQRRSRGGCSAGEARETPVTDGALLGSRGGYAPETGVARKNSAESRRADKGI